MQSVHKVWLQFKKVITKAVDEIFCIDLLYFTAQYRQRLATAATFFRSCVAQALSRGDGPRHS